MGSRVNSWRSVPGAAGAISHVFLGSAAARSSGTPRCRCSSCRVSGADAVGAGERFVAPVGVVLGVVHDRILRGRIAEFVDLRKVTGCDGEPVLIGVGAVVLALVEEPDRAGAEHVSAGSRSTASCSD